MKEFVHHNVGSIDEAVSLLQKHGGKAKLNAGGTDLLGLLKDMVMPDYPESIINIKGIEGLDYIEEDKEGLKIGPLTKLSNIARSPVVRDKWKILSEAAGSVATPQIRNMATIGGNLAQDVRCWYYRYPNDLGGRIVCLRKGGAVCNALAGDNRYHSIFGTAHLASYPCATSCPANTNIPSYLSRIRDGNLVEAAQTLMEFNPMPAITGRVCPTFCEPRCHRNKLDDPVAVRCIERSIGDYMLENMDHLYLPPQTESGKKVAIVGSGPAGLSAAFYLRRAGHSVTVYEKLSEAGGMLFHSIPPYRLPKDIVKKQIEALRKMGIVLKLGVNVGKDEAMKGLSASFDAVLVACGTWKEKAQDIKGNVPFLSGLEFLRKVNCGDRSIPGRKVAIIGAGNTAIDVARTLIRMGSKPVVIYRRGQKEMPAFKDEVEKARQEGVLFRFLALPTEASKIDDKITLTCTKMKLGDRDASGRRRPVPKPGSEFTVSFDAVIRAIGEEPDTAFLPTELQNGARKDASGHLLGRNIFRAGDFVTGSSTVIEAVASGREAAGLIRLSLADHPTLVEKNGLTKDFVWPCFDEEHRVSVTDVPISERLKGIDTEDRQGINMEEAQREASRCFNCGCVAVNPSDIGVALLALNGKIVTTKRNIDAKDFFAPHATASTILDADEVIKEIRLPRVPDGTRQNYLKFTLRKPVDFAIVSVGCVVSLKNGICTDACIALGAVGPAPLRVRTAEKTLIGKSITEKSVTEAAEAALESAKPLARNAYKIQITKSLVKKAIMGNGSC